MPNPAFVHLRLHSEFSITDGIVRIDEAVARAAADGMPALAITDLANVFGMVKFYKAARAAGVKPIVGCDVWIANESERDKPHRLLLLTQSRAGYLRLSELLTRAWLENQYRGRAELRKAWFGEGTEGLIALSGAMQGDVAAALLQDHREPAKRLAMEWARLFPGRFYLELQRAGAPQAESYIEAAVRLAGSCSLPVVATHPVQFLKTEDFTAHEARVCIAEGQVLGDKRRPRPFTPESYFLSQAEMATRFADLPEALANSVEIARRCNLALELGKPKLPVFPTPPGVTREEYLRQQAQDGLERRLAANNGARADEKWKEKYKLRLEVELRTIIQMGFAGYFLIVADFINWA
ncbi:MAG: PHP domain-containing protein, partial [Betaproteobacteria bacterium]